jgi:hypothetical protein
METQKDSLYIATQTVTYIGFPDSYRIKFSKQRHFRCIHTKQKLSANYVLHSSRPGKSRK